MLLSAEIKGLFGLYSYNLNFSSSNEESLKFITGPNGYGKTTLLTFINSLYTCNFDIYYRIPFTSLKFIFDSASIEIKQILGESEENLMDEEYNIDTSLEVLFSLNAKPDEVEVSKLEKVFHPNQIKPNLHMYLSSLSCYYIKDQRLNHKQAILQESLDDERGDTPICAVKDNAADLKKLLTKCKERLSNTLNVTKLVFSNSISEEEYNDRVQKILPKLRLFKKFALTDDNFLPKKYESQNAVFLNAFLNALETAITESYSFVERLEAFSEIIDSCELVDKEFKINPRFGFRFVSKNSLSTIIEPENLSSGEQHISVLAYELLFKAQDFTLVLIDEPEISFHLMWQMKFLKNLQSIMDLRKIQCIVATHSPQIFSQNWDLTVDLYKQSKQS